MSTPSTIRSLIEAYQSMVMARHHLVKLRQRIKEEQQTCKTLQQLLENEYKDIETLEKFDFSPLFRFMLKNKDEQMEIERQEYLHAVLKYREAQRMVELLEYERQVLEEKLEREAIVKAELDAALRHRKQQINEEYPKLITQLNRLDQEQDEQVALQRELREAIIVGVKATQLLGKMAKQLKQIKDWGQWSAEQPAPKGKNKNGLIDQVQQQSYRVKQLLQEFEDELEDIYAFQQNKSPYRYEEFTHFTDLHTNRLISDWIVRKKIRSTLSNAKAVQDSLMLVIQSLKQTIQQSEQRAAELQAEREKMIEEWKV